MAVARGKRLRAEGKRREVLCPGWGKVLGETADSVKLVFKMVNACSAVGFPRSAAIIVTGIVDVLAVVTTHL